MPKDAELVKLDSVNNKGCSPESIKGAMYDLIIRMRRLDNYIGRDNYQAKQLNYLNVSCALSLCSLMGFPPPGVQDTQCIEDTITVEVDITETGQFPRTKRLGETQTKQITNNK